jgi:hypothetical protein
MRDELNIGAIGPEWTLDVADMNLDGCADLVGTTAQNDLGIWINEGAAGDRTHRRLEHRNIGKLGLEWQQLVFADVDRDQRFDLIAQSDDGSIGRWKWNGTPLQPNPDDIGRAPTWTVYAGGGHLR